jgi:ectoine hydroxylase-related dioxygenase (phytanoyl-CoA dioxygenase family)
MTQATLKLDESLLPSAEDVKAYRENGYYISKKVLTDAELDEAVRQQDLIYSGVKDLDFEHVYGWKPADGDVLRKTDYTYMINQFFNRFDRNPYIGAIAARLAGKPEIRIWTDQLLYKPGTQRKSGGSVNVGWHTDKQYWQSCTSNEMLTAWVPFQDTDAELGTVTMIKGSNQWPALEGLDFFDGNMEALEAKFSGLGKAVVKVPMLLPKGCVSFHNCLTIHGSGANLTDRPRRSIAIHLQPGDNAWMEVRKPDGSLAGDDNDRLVRKTADGKPDYTDPRYCPRIYPA